jgi:hypothetical protein
LQESRLKHFSDEDWINYLREVMPPASRSSAEQHLQTGCPQCVRSKAFWQAINEIARRERENEVPEKVNEAAEALFLDWRRKFVLPNQARRARPIFDSLLEPIPAGVRAANRPPRRVVQRSNRWTIDLRIESEPGDRVWVAGQVIDADRRHPEEEFKAGILLMSRDILLDETAVNSFGEFQFTFQRVPELMIYIELQGRPAIAVALPEADQPLPVKRRYGAKTSQSGLE